MSFSNTYRFLAAIVFILSEPLLPQANQRNASGNVDLLPGGKSTPRRPRPASSGATTSICEKIAPIFPPTFTPTQYLFSMRAEMFLQILPDGKINGTTLTFSEYAKLHIEVLNKWCMVRIKGVASQRYLVMQPNGTLISQTQPDKKRSIFNIQVQKGFISFENANNFIALKREGTIKKIKGNVNGTSSRRSTRFVIVGRLSRKRRFRSGFDFSQSMGNSDSRKLFGNLQRR